MSLIKTSLLALALMVCAIVNAQQVKPKFKELKIITYNPIISGKGTQVAIYANLDISKSGKVHNKVLSSLVTNATMDTTYQLSNNLISRLNKFFNGKNKLETYMVVKNLPADEFYSDEYKFITFTDNNNITHDFIYLKPLMDNAFNTLLDVIVRMPKTISKHDSLYQDKVLMNQIIKCQGSCTYFPETEREEGVVSIEAN